MAVCKHCHKEGKGKYCSYCGDTFEASRITIPSILHEIVHTITHAETGFFYTLKNLATRPGKMQKAYLEGERKINQKPFSLFFICASVTAIALHFINTAPEVSRTHFDIVKANFFKNYYVILQSILLPVYSFFLWVILGSKKLNYTEALVFMFYSLAFSLIIIIPLNLTGFIPGFKYQQYLEVIFLTAYIIATNLNFFTEQKKWIVVIKSIILMFACYLLSNIMAGQVINFML